MQRYTQQDYDALVRDEEGYLYCQTGDWSAVAFGGADEVIFADGCDLGCCCTLGDGCALEDGRVQDAAYFAVSPISGKHRRAYAYCNTRTGEIYVRAGCWFSGIDDFERRVRVVHAGTRHETDYLAFAAFARARFARYGEPHRPYKEDNHG